MDFNVKFTKIFVLVCFCNFLAGGTDGLAVDRSVPESSPEKQNKSTGIEIGKVLPRLGESLETPKPTNAILLLVEDTQDQQEFWNKLPNSEAFKVHGVAHSCSNGHQDCFCDNVLKSKVTSLLTWARMNNEMTTSTLFRSIPVGRNLPAAKMDGSVEAAFLEKNQRFSPTSLDTFIGNAKKANKLFENSLESTLQGLKQLGVKYGGKGYLLVVSANGHDSTNAVELINRHAIDKDTLVVIVSCSSFGRFHPYFARGLGSKNFERIQKITEIPSAVQCAIGGFDANVNCEFNENNLPIRSAKSTLHEFSVQDILETVKRGIRKSNPSDEDDDEVIDFVKTRDTNDPGNFNVNAVGFDKAADSPIFKGSADQLVIGNTYIYGLAITILIPIMMKY